jgi:hypothetical protein
MGLLDNAAVHKVSALVWESITAPEDTNQANNGATVGLTVAVVDPSFIFADGFEQGSYSGWSNAIP